MKGVVEERTEDSQSDSFGGAREEVGQDDNMERSLPSISKVVSSSTLQGCENILNPRYLYVVPGSPTRVLLTNVLLHALLSDFPALTMSG